MVFVCLANITKDYGRSMGLIMDHVVAELERGQDPAHRSITHAEYRDWQRGYIFDGLRTLRYGQSFCRHFNITDNILFYNILTQTDADQYIRKVYVK
jgi:hypothetical protein